MSFRFPSPSSVFAKSEVSAVGIDMQKPQNENGGLFNKEECSTLARYPSFNQGTLSRSMIPMEMEYAIR